EDALAAADDAAGREVRPLDDVFLQELFDGHVGVVDDANQGAADLAKVVRRNVGGHADGDAVGAVDQQVGELAGQHQRLAILAVVVVDVIDRVVVEIRQHFSGYWR